MHLTWRWFTGLGFDQEIPHHSTFSKNWHGRFQESKLFEQLFERILQQCGYIVNLHLPDGIPNPHYFLRLCWFSLKWKEGALR